MTETPERPETSTLTVGAHGGDANVVNTVPLVELRFEGWSDDTFGCECAARPDIDTDFDNCANGKPIMFEVTSGDDTMMVVGQYAPKCAGGWLIGIAPPDSDEDHSIPGWTMRFELSDRYYSPRLVILAPADVKVKHVR